MQQTTGVAILATQLATTDRRALSQAWYSALHLAERSRPRDGGGLPRARSGHEPQTAHAEQRIAGHPAGSPAAARPSHEADTPRRIETRGATERRAPKTDLARRIERRIARHAPRTAPASFAISAGDGRVHVLIRSDGAATRIVAVCAPTLRTSVERALAQARFALAGRGMRTEVA